MHAILITGGNQAKRAEQALKLGGLAENSPDLKVISLKENRKVIGIDEIRELQRSIIFKPYQAPQKVGVIMEAQSLSEEAQNALLKTLEEPPASSLLILTSDHLTKLLPTVISRCEIRKLPPEIGVFPSSTFHQKQIGEFVRVLGMNRGERLQWVEENKEIFKDSHNVANILSIWESVLRDSLLVNQGCTTYIANNQMLDLIPKNIPDNQIISSCKLLGQARELVSSTNANPRLLLEQTFLMLQSSQVEVDRSHS